MPCGMTEGSGTGLSRSVRHTGRAQDVRQHHPDGGGIGNLAYQGLPSAGGCLLEVWQPQGHMC